MIKDPRKKETIFELAKKAFMIKQEDFKPSEEEA